MDRVCSIGQNGHTSQHMVENQENSSINQPQKYIPELQGKAAPGLKSIPLAFSYYQQRHMMQYVHQPMSSTTIPLSLGFSFPQNPLTVFATTATRKHVESHHTVYCFRVWGLGKDFVQGIAYCFRAICKCSTCILIIPYNIHMTIKQ